MSPDEFRQLAEQIYGEQWKLKLAIEVHVHTNSVDRWLRTGSIPGTVSALLREKARNMGARPDHEQAT